MIATHAVPMTMVTELAKRRAWIEDAFTSATTLLLSFILLQNKICFGMAFLLCSLPAVVSSGFIRELTGKANVLSVCSFRRLSERTY